MNDYIIIILLIILIIIVIIKNKKNNNQVVGSCLQYNDMMIHFSGFLKDSPDIPQYKSEVA